MLKSKVIKSESESIGDGGSNKASSLWLGNLQQDTSRFRSSPMNSSLLDSLKCDYFRLSRLPFFYLAPIIFAVASVAADTPKAAKMMKAKASESVEVSSGDSGEPARKRKASLLNEEGVALFFQGSKEQGLAKIKQAMAHDPSNSAILYNLAGIYLTQGDLEPAKLVIEKAIALDPKDVPFLCRYGEILMSSSNFEDAVEVFNQILSIEPKHSSAMLKLGATYGMLEKWDLAEKTLREAHKLRGDDISLISNLGNILVVREKYEEAIKLLERAQHIRANADNAVSLGIAYEAIGKKEHALRHYKEAKSLGHQDANLDSHISDLSSSNE